MLQPKYRIEPNAWAQNIFSGSRVARTGGPIRVRLASIHRYSSMRTVLIVARGRGYVALQIGEYVIFYPGAAVGLMLVDAAGGIAPLGSVGLASTT